MIVDGKIGKKHHLYKHGHRKKSGSSSTYTTWMSMKSRCFYKNDNNYAWYGARGITVCERWLSFENFLNDMGERPEGTTIDRINADGNYEPGNCRWATTKEQAANRKNTTVINFKGELLTLPEIGKKYEIPTTTIYRRYAQGYRNEKLIEKSNFNRYRTGEKTPGKKLTKENVDEIKIAISLGETLTSISNRYGVSQPTISDIKNGKTWKD